MNMAGFLFSIRLGSVRLEPHTMCGIVLDQLARHCTTSLLHQATIAAPAAPGHPAGAAFPTAVAEESHSSVAAGRGAAAPDSEGATTVLDAQQGPGLGMWPGTGQGWGYTAEGAVGERSGHAWAAAGWIPEGAQQLPAGTGGLPGQWVAQEPLRRLGSLGSSKPWLHQSSVAKGRWGLL